MFEYVGSFETSAPWTVVMMGFTIGVDTGAGGGGTTQPHPLSSGENCNNRKEIQREGKERTGNMTRQEDV